MWPVAFALTELTAAEEARISARLEFSHASFAISLNILNEQLHLLDLADLSFNNLVCQLTNARVADTRFAGIVDGDGVVGDH